MDNRNNIYQLIDNLRLPMMLGVIFCHTHFYKYLTPEELSTDLYINFPIMNTVIYFCYWIVGKVFTPTFFFFSGYLFYREHQLTTKIYFAKIKRRFFSLFIPYIIWNAIVLFIMYLQEKYIGSTSPRMGHISEYGFSDVLYAFFDTSHSFSFIGDIGQPANIPLWFLRDLIFLSILSPLLYYIAKLPKLIGPIILFAIYSSPLHLPHLQNLSIFWFGLGIWMQINEINFIKLSKSVVWYCIPIFIILTVAYELIRYYHVELSINFIVPLMRISESAILFALTDYLLNISKKRLPEKIKNSSFFVYVSHVVPTAIACTLVCHILPHTDFFLTIAYLCIPFVVMAVLVVTYLIMIRLFPKLTKIITGSR